jgi:hypothetical protein
LEKIACDSILRRAGSANVAKFVPRPLNVRGGEKKEGDRKSKKNISKLRLSQFMGVTEPRRVLLSVLCEFEQAV